MDSIGTKNIVVREMSKTDWLQVASIYKQGIETNQATFQREVPTYDVWDGAHLPDLRFVACDEETVVGWTALSAISSRDVYKGVCEVSIYVHENYHGHKIASKLYEHLINLSEMHGIWMLQAGIMEENIASIKLHEKFGFRIVGYRERIAKDHNDVWRNTILMERRSARVE